MQLSAAAAAAAVKGGGLTVPTSVKSVRSTSSKGSSVSWADTAMAACAQKRAASQREAYECHTAMKTAARASAPPMVSQGALSPAMVLTTAGKLPRNLTTDFTANSTTALRRM